MCAHGHARRSTAANAWQTGITPNLLITHLWKIVSPPIVLHEPCPQSTNGSQEQQVNLEGAEMCIVFQYSLTATGTCMQSTHMHQVHS